jgi:ketosteroid isomerase-like protein
MSARLNTARAYEAALFAGMLDEVGRLFTDDLTYWVAGAPPIGGERKGRAAVLLAFENREFGLGAADWGYEDVWRVWYEADERVIVEIRERSWLKTHPDDVIDQRTCVVIRFAGERIAEMREYADSHIYEGFVRRHRDELPKFRGRG